jgi:hypothetical protein
MSSTTLYDIWENPNGVCGLSWCAQMVGYVAQFRTQEQAEKHVQGVKDYRKRFTLDTPNPVRKVK